MCYVKNTKKPIIILTGLLSTFGLISENKNIETTLFALPEIVKHPSLIYLIIGNTSRSYQKTKGKIPKKTGYTRQT
jgi:hypothetical protein